MTVLNGSGCLGLDLTLNTCSMTLDMSFHQDVFVPSVKWRQYMQLSHLNATIQQDATVFLTQYLSIGIVVDKGLLNAV